MIGVMKVARSRYITKKGPAGAEHVHGGQG